MTFSPKTPMSGVSRKIDTQPRYISNESVAESQPTQQMSQAKNWAKDRQISPIAEQIKRVDMLLPSLEIEERFRKSIIGADATRFIRRELQSAGGAGDPALLPSPLKQQPGLD